MMKSTVKIFPSLVAVAVLALGVKVTGFVTDYDLFTQPALAQDAPDPQKPQVPDEKKDADKAGEKPAVPASGKKVDDLDQMLSDDDLTTAEEEATLRLLTSRRRELDKREQMIDLKEKMLEALDGDLKDKIAKLEAIRAEIAIQLGDFTDAEKRKNEKLVAYYNKMKPKDAALIFAQLVNNGQVRNNGGAARNENRQEVLLRVIKDMKDSQVSKILAEMTAQDASKITMKLAMIARPNVDGLLGK